MRPPYVYHRYRRHPVVAAWTEPPEAIRANILTMAKAVMRRRWCP